MTEWVSAKELMAAFGVDMVFVPHTTACAVAKRAHVGLLRSRAKLLKVGNDVRRDADIPKAFWWAEGFEALDQDWQRGDFSTWIDNKLEMQAFGVTFSRDDAEEMGAEFEPVPMVPLSAFEPIDREAAEQWHRETWWSWIDAVAWVATRSTEAMQILTAYRAFHLRSPGQPLINERARWSIAQSLMKPSEARAAESLLMTALRQGALAARGAVSSDAPLTLIDASEWTRLARPTLASVALEGDPASAVFHNVRLSVPQVLARWPITEPIAAPGPSQPHDKAAWEAECKRVAALLDEEVVAVRDVRASHVAARWNPSIGKPPKVPAITNHMAGKPKEGRPVKCRDK